MSLLSLLLTCSLVHPVSEFEGNEMRARQMHDNTLLPMLIYFSSDNCTPCAQFDALFEEPETLKKMEQHYVPVRVSIDDFDGRACADIYGISSVPAFVIADHKGIILYKSDATLSVHDIQLLLEAVPGEYPNVKAADLTNTNEIQENQQNSSDRDAVIVSVPSSEPEPQMNYGTAVAISEVKFDAPIKHEVSLSKTPEQDATLNCTTPVNSNPTNSNNTKEEITKPILRVDNTQEVMPAKPKAEIIPKAIPNRQPAHVQRKYSIQLGFFSEAPNAKTLVQKAKQKGLTETRTETEQRDGKSCYRVLVGSFTTLSEAQTLLTEVNALGLKGAVHRQ